MKRILFAVNGFGMGNATRCDALASLIGEGNQIDFITSDKALQYFQSGSRSGTVYPQVNIHTGNAGRFGTPLFFLKYIPHFLKRMAVNFLTQRKLTLQNKYDLIIFDSDYSFVLHRIFRTRAVLVGINNSYEVLNYFLKNPRAIRPSLLPSLVMEAFDFAIHSVFCRFVLCPSIKPEALKSLFGKFMISPLLVREKFFTQPPYQEKSGVMIMASSSQVDSPIASLAPAGFVADNIRQLQETLAVVCNAGQSSISECFYLNKRTLLIPIPKHAEQLANAHLASEKGMQFSTVLTKIDFSLSKPRYNYDYPESAAVVKRHFNTIQELLK